MIIILMNKLREQKMTDKSSSLQQRTIMSKKMPETLKLVLNMTLEMIQMAMEMDQVDQVEKELEVEVDQVDLVDMEIVQMDMLEIVKNILID